MAAGGHSTGRSQLYPDWHESFGGLVAGAVRVRCRAPVRAASLSLGPPHQAEAVVRGVGILLVKVLLQSGHDAHSILHRVAWPAGMVPGAQADRLFESGSADA